jgi:hypothetical protein
MVWPMEKVKGWKQDIDCLAAMWLRGVQGKSHKERLEFFYGPQAHACEFVIFASIPWSCCSDVAWGESREVARSPWSFGVRSFYSF